MRPHHEAWLAANTHRTEEWLRERVKDGFDIHHMDGDHSNNDPANLVLIEHVDHMRLHGMRNALGRVANRSGGVRRKKPLNPLAKAGYEMKRRTAFNWSEVASLIGAPSGQVAWQMAKVYANRHELPWPLPAAPVVGSDAAA